MKVLVNRAPFARIVRDGSREITFTSGPNLVSDETLEIPAVARLLAYGALRERPLPQGDREWSGGDLPECTSALTETAALRAIVAARRDDTLLLKTWRDTDPRPNVRAAIDRALTNLHLAPLLV